MLADTVRAGQQEGSIRADVDVDAAAVVITGMTRGVAALSLTQPGTADMTVVRRLCGELLATALNPAGSSGGSGA